MIDDQTFSMLYYYMALILGQWGRLGCGQYWLVDIDDTIYELRMAYEIKDRTFADLLFMLIVSIITYSSMLIL